MSKPRGFNVVTPLIFLFLAASGYLSFIYVPILWKRSELQSFLKEESYSVKRRSPEEARQAIKAAAEDRLGVVLSLDEVEVERLEDRGRVRVTWRPVVTFFTGHQVQHAFRFDVETVFY